jgi:hypothetical protein
MPAHVPSHVATSAGIPGARIIQHGQPDVEGQSEGLAAVARLECHASVAFGLQTCQHTAFCLMWSTLNSTLNPILDATEEDSERRISKAGYDITPLTLAKQKELAAGLTPHQRCSWLRLAVAAAHRYIKWPS